MKRLTATDARRNWFRLLDEVAAGETVVVERRGRRIVIRLDEPRDEGAIPDYADVIRVVDDPAEAAAWGWVWSEDGLAPAEIQPDASRRGAGAERGD